MEIKPKMKQAVPGQNVNFQCFTSSPEHKIEWSKKDGSLPKSSAIKSNGMLSLYGVREKDAGTYVCSIKGLPLSVEATLTLSEVISISPPNEHTETKRVHFAFTAGSIYTSESENRAIFSHACQKWATGDFGMPEFWGSSSNCILEP